MMLPSLSAEVHSAISLLATNMSETPQTQQLAERKQKNLFIFHKEKKKNWLIYRISRLFSNEVSVGLYRESQTHTVIHTLTLLEKWVTARSVTERERHSPVVSIIYFYNEIQ